MFLGKAKCNTLVLYFVNNGRTKEVIKRKTEEEKKKKRADQIRMPEAEKNVKTHLLWLPLLHYVYVALLLWVCWNEILADLRQWMKS